MLKEWPLPVTFAVVLARDAERVQTRDRGRIRACGAAPDDAVEEPDHIMFRRKASGEGWSKDGFSIESIEVVVILPERGKLCVVRKKERPCQWELKVHVGQATVPGGERIEESHDGVNV